MLFTGSRYCIAYVAVVTLFTVIHSVPVHRYAVNFEMHMTEREADRIMEHVIFNMSSPLMFTGMYRCLYGKNRCLNV